MPPERVSLDRIRAALNTEGDPWQAGVTNVSALPPEQQKLRLGVAPPPGTPDPETASRVRGAAALASSVGAPASFFWGTPDNNK